MELTKLHDPKDGPMNIVGLMSGKGSNLVKIIEFERELDQSMGKSPYHLKVIFSDCFDSNATQIGKDYDLPVVSRDIGGFYKSRGQPRGNMEVRAEFDTQTVKALSPYEVSVAAYAGYMSIATPLLINTYLGANVHPIDLSIKEGNKIKYTGNKAVENAINAGEEYLRSTTHLIEEGEVDYGGILMISKPLKIDHRLTAEGNQEKLKEVGDWIIFPKTLLYLSEGFYSKDSEGKLYFKDELIKNGLRLDK